METKWTKGPWLISTPTQGYEVCTMHGLPPQPSEDGRGQTWVYIRPESLTRNGEWHWPDEAECTANARLISAAPDMAEALRLFIHYDEATDDDGVQLMLNYADALSAAKAALAKARGEA